MQNPESARCGPDVDKSGEDVTDTLYFGDNLEALRSGLVKSDSVDLVYLDPPFNSNANYNVLFRSPTGSKSRAQKQAFEDTWHWGEEAERAYKETAESRTPVAGIIRALRTFLKTNDMMAYLAIMAVRFIELHRVMKPTGSLYLHCDPTASHYLKIILDGVFGPQNFRNEIVWLRSKNPKGSQHANRKYSPHTDSLLYYVKSQDAPIYLDDIRIRLSAAELDQKYNKTDERGRWLDGPILCSASMGPRPNLVYTYKGFTPGEAGWRVNPARLREIDEAGNLYWTATGAPRRKFRPEDDRGDPVGNFWGDIAPVNSQAEERIGYPTQKPLALLERVLKASSRAGDLVLDPFCGCGTAVHAAQKLGRRWVGIDITHIAIQIIEDRLRKYFPAVKPRVIGRPKDLEGAAELAKIDKHEFQDWAVWLAGGWPVDGVTKKGMDRGVDGELYFKMSSTNDGRAIISVKGGQHLNPGMVRDLKGTREGEGADMALFVCLESPTPEMKAAAATAGFLPGEGDEEPTPRVQILTIQELLTGKRPRLPPLYDTQTAAAAGRAAARARKPKIPTPDEIRRQPGFKLPLPGGKGTQSQPPLALPEPLLTAQSASRAKRRRA